MARLVICLLVSSILCLTGCSKGDNNISQIKNQVQNKFCLNYEEKRVYDYLKDDIDDKYLKNLNELNIIRLYIQTQIDNRYDIEKILFLNESDNIIDNKTESQSQDMAKEVWFGIQQGEFQQSEKESNFIYETKDGEKIINIIKDKNGIWKIDEISFLKGKTRAI